MIICKVVGHVWSTKKDPELEGLKLMIVKDMHNGQNLTYVAADVVGAGVGEEVLVVSGSTAREAGGGDDGRAERAVVGIMDAGERNGAAGKVG